jgi:hypothetical protein
VSVGPLQAVGLAVFCLLRSSVLCAGAGTRARGQLRQPYHSHKMTSSSSPLRKFLRADLDSLVYHPVRPLDVISEEIGIKAEDIAKLDANENLHPVPAPMMAAVTEALQSFSSGCSAQIYPDPSQTHFRAAIANLHSAHGVTPDMVCAGSGSDDILDIIMRVVDAKNCIICPPTFGMYKFLGAISKIEIIEVPRKPTFEVDVAAVVAAGTQFTPRFTCFTSTTAQILTPEEQCARTAASSSCFPAPTIPQARSCRTQISKRSARRTASCASTRCAAV